MQVVVVVCVSGVPVCVASAGTVSAPFPSVGSRHTDVDGLRIWETDEPGSDYLHEQIHVFDEQIPECAQGLLR